MYSKEKRVTGLIAVLLLFLVLSCVGLTGIQASATDLTQFDKTPVVPMYADRVFTDDTGTWIFSKADNAVVNTDVMILGVTSEHRGDTSLRLPAQLKRTVDTTTTIYDVTSIRWGLYRVNASVYYESGFAGMSNLETVTFETNPKFKKIYNTGYFTDFGLFQGTKVKEITLPDSIVVLDTTDGLGIFANSVIEQVEFNPVSLCDIGTNTFYNCQSLKTFEIKNNYNFVGSKTFNKANLINGITWETGYSRNALGGSYLFAETEMKSFTFPDSIASISSYAFYKCASLETVKFGANLNEISSYAFSECNSLKSVDFEGTALVNLGINAFLNDTQLTSVKFPQTILNIGDFAFSGCKGLQTVSFPKNCDLQSIGVSAFRNTSALSTLNIVAPNLKVINNNAFDTTGLTTINIESTKDVVFGTYAISGNKKLTDFTLKSMTKKLAANMFSNCSILRTVTVPDTVTVLDGGAFDGCAKLEHIDTPNIETISSTVFRNTGLKTITVGDKLTSIGTYAFENTPLESFYFGQSLQTIGERAFVGTSLTNVDFSSSPNLKTIGAAAFAEAGISTLTFNGNTTTELKLYSNAFNRNNITTLYIPKNINLVENSVFYNCEKLGTVQFESDAATTKLPNSTFSECTNLTSVKLPTNLVTIGNSAFQNCNILTDVNFTELNTLTSIGDSAFEKCSSLPSLYVPATVTYIGTKAFMNNTALSAVTFNSDTNLAVLSNYCFSGTTNLQAIRLPLAVTSINENAFEKSGITSINLSELAKLTTIKNYAFRSTKLKDVLIPKAVTTIGTYAFLDISGLETFKWEEGTQFRAFAQNMVGDANSYTLNLTIPASVTTMPNSAIGTAGTITFEDGCALTSVGTGMISGVDYIYNLPLCQDTVKELINSDMGYSPRGVKGVTFAPNSTVKKIYDSFYYIEEFIEFPDSLEYWVCDRGTIVNGTKSYFKGTTLDLKNIKYVGPMKNNYTVYQNFDVISAYLYNVPNLENFKAPELTVLKGMYYTNNNAIDFKINAPKLQYFEGGFDFQNPNMMEYFPEGMIYVAGACSEVLQNSNVIAYFPDTVEYCFYVTSGNYNTMNDWQYSATMVVPNNLVKVRAGNCGVWSTFTTSVCGGRFVVNADNTTFSIAEWPEQAWTPGITSNFNKDKKGIAEIYVSDETMYNHISTEIATKRYGLQHIKLYRRDTSLTSQATGTTTGMNLNVTIKADAPTIAGTLEIYNLSEELGEGEIRKPVATLPATSKTLSYDMDDFRLVAGVNNFEIRYISSTPLTMDSNTFVTYTKAVTPVTITTDAVVAETVTISGTVTTPDNYDKVLRGTLNIYYITDTNEEVLVVTKDVNGKSETISTTLDIDSAYLRSGTNMYKILFKSEDEATYSSMYKMQTVEYTGTDAGLSLVLNETKGGLTANASILSDALNYGTLKIYLGDNNGAEIINVNNSTSAYIDPRKLVEGTNKVMAVYEAHSARYASAKVIVDYIYNPIKTALEMQVLLDSNNNVNIVVSVVNDNITDANGTLKLYHGDSEAGVFLKAEQSKQLTAIVSRNNLDFGENMFYAEWEPNDTTTAFAKVINSAEITGKPVTLLGSTTNRGDTVAVIGKVMCSNVVLNPLDIKMYQGATELDVPLVVTLGADGVTAVAEVSKTNMFVGTNIFYLVYEPSDKQYARQTKTVTFNMGPDGSETSSDDITKDDIIKVIEELAKISNGMEINIEKLIVALNNNFDVLNGSLEDILKALVEIADKETPDYSGKFDALIEAIKQLDGKLNSGGSSGGTSSNADIKAILEAMLEQMTENNSNYQMVVNALAELKRLEEIESELSGIKQEIANGNVNSEQILEQLKALTQNINSAFDTSEIEAMLKEIVNAISNINGSNNGNSEINGILNDINKTLEDLKNNVNNTGDKVEDAITDGSNNIQDAINNVNNNLVDSIDSVVNAINNNGEKQKELQEIVNAINGLKDGTNNSTDMADIIKALEKIVSDSAQDKTVLDISGLEAAVSNIKGSGYSDTAVLEAKLDDLKKVIANNKVDLSKMEEALDNITYYLKQMAESGTSGKNYDNSELVTALNRIGTMINNANKPGIDEKTMSDLLIALNKIELAISNDKITSEDLKGIVDAISNIKLEPVVVDSPAMLDTLGTIAQSFDGLKTETAKLASIMRIFMIVVGLSIVAMGVIVALIVRKPLKMQNELLKKLLNGNDEDNQG